MQKLNNAHLSVLYASLAMGLLYTAGENRAEHLGGWDKAIRKNGPMTIRDQGIERVQRVEQRLFEVMDRAIKELGKTTPKLLDSPSPNEVYDLAAIVVENVDFVVNEFTNGNQGAITYADGYRQALDDAARLMFAKKMTRSAAIDELLQKFPLPQDLREVV